MSEPFYRDFLNDPLDLGFAPVEIDTVDGEPPSPLPPALPATPGPVVGRWLDERQNSRLARALPQGTWSVEWETALEVGGPPVSLQQAGERILLQSQSQWELFERSGKSVADGQFAYSDLLLDPELEVFYSQQHNAGAFQADRLSDGERRFVTVLGWAKVFQRSFMARLEGNRLAVAGHHRDTVPHGKSPEVSGMEVWSFGDPVVADHVAMLESGRRTAVLQHKSRCLVVAKHGATFVVAVKDGIYLSDADLNLTAGLIGSFVPRRLSLDEAGRMHLVVDDARGTQCYWLVTPEGKHLAAVALPVESEGEIAAPPIVGYDHTAYLVTPLMVRAVDDQGRLLWESDFGGRLGGAAVSGDDRLLVAAGDSVSTFTITAEGDERTVTREPLITLEGQALATAPILTADGRLLVASAKRLYCCQAT